MPHRIPTPGVATPKVRTSKIAQPAVKPVIRQLSPSQASERGWQGPETKNANPIRRGFQMGGGTE